MSEPNIRPIRSFVLREGRMTKGQQRAMAELIPLYGLTITPGTHIDFNHVFGNTHPVTLEIGFGDGQALFEMAKNNPEQNFLGIEVHRPGVGSLLLQLEQHDIKNVRVLADDGVEVLRHAIKPQSIDRIHLFFPDPWHKKRHNKRRILNDEFIQLINQALSSAGVFHFATDWEHYAEEALERLESSKIFVNLAGTKQYSPRPDYRPLTKFERRGHRLGHGVWDMLMQKI